MTSEIERILGGSIDRPGLAGRTGDPMRARYVSFVVKGDPVPFMKKVVFHADPPLVLNGGVIFDEGIVTIPDGTRFYALVLNGDLPAWHKQIQIGADHYGVLTAGWSGDAFCLSDGRVFDIESCKISQN